MNARDIQRRVIVDRYRKTFCLPNYTPTGWFECDVFELTNAGYFREYEIKISRSDFMADAKKYCEVWSRGTTHNKHQMLARPADAPPAGFFPPTQFWFVVPENLVQLADVPDWAGLIYATPSSQRTPWNVMLNEVRPAPRLHENKPDLKLRQHATGVCYWRFNHNFVKGKYESTPQAPDELAQ